MADILDRLRPHPLTPDKGVVYCTAQLLREACEEIENLRRSTQRREVSDWFVAKSLEPGLRGGRHGG